MKNLWPENIEELEGFETPKSVLESQSTYLSKATYGEVYASVDERFDKFSNATFIFEFNIRGKYLDTYKFTAFTIEHDIQIYPLTIQFDEDIAKEVGADPFTNGLKIKNPEEFEKTLVGVFKSKKMENVIKSIKGLS